MKDHELYVLVVSTIPSQRVGDDIGDFKFMSGKARQYNEKVAWKNDTVCAVSLDEHFITLQNAFNSDAGHDYL